MLSASSLTQRRSLLAVLLTLVLVATLLATTHRHARHSAQPAALTTAEHSDLSTPEQLSDTHIRWNGHIYARQADSASRDAPFSIAAVDEAQLDSDKAAKKEAKAGEKAAKKSPDLVPMYSGAWWISAGCAFACVCVAALAAGLTVGLVSIDPFDLQVILETDEADAETEEEKKQLRRDKKSASKLLPIVRRHHLLLVTLLLLNSAANETLPLFLDRMVPSWVAVVMSVTLVLMFGEILPSALFTGSGQLTLAAALTPVVWVCMITFGFIAYPIAKVLDWWLGNGEEQELFKRGELKALVRMQSAGHAAALSNYSSTDNSSPTSPSSQNNHNSSRNNNSSSSASSSLLASALHRNDSTESAHDGHTTHEAGLATDEIAIITGALEMKVTSVGQVCLAWDQVFALSTEDQLSYDTLARMLAVGHSRIPVYSGRRDNVIGVMLTKRLIVINPEDERRVSTLSLRRPMFVSPDLSLYDCLNDFQRGVSHLAIVCEQPQLAEERSKAGEELPAEIGIRGIVTLEDLLERLIKEEIVDETDPHGVMAELSGVQRRKRRLAAFRKAAMRRHRMMGGASTVLGVIKEERNRKRSSASDRSSGGQAEKLRLVTRSPTASSPQPSPLLPSGSLLTPNSARSDSGAGYGSVDDGGRTSSSGMSITTKRWLRATEKVVTERHLADLQEHEAHGDGATGEDHKGKVG